MEVIEWRKSEFRLHVVEALEKWVWESMTSLNPITASAAPTCTLTHWALPFVSIHIIIIHASLTFFFLFSIIIILLNILLYLYIFIYALLVCLLNCYWIFKNAVLLGTHNFRRSFWLFGCLFAKLPHLLCSFTVWVLPKWEIWIDIRY